MPPQPRTLPSIPLIPSRTLHLTPPLRLRQKPTPPNPPPDDYYSLLLSSPLASAPSSTETPPASTSPPSISSSQQTPKPKTPRSSHKLSPNPKIVFGSRLAGPAERREKILQAGENAERPREPDNCCMSGCVNCVWDIYREEVEEWAARRRERERAGMTRVANGGGSEGAVGGLDGVGGWSEEAELREEGLFEGVPVGIREFMATEKKLRERRGEKG